MALRECVQRLKGYVRNAYELAAANCGIQAAAANPLLLVENWRSAKTFLRVWAFRRTCATKQILPPITTFDGVFMRNDKC
jgi:hypothetical protein